MPSYGCGQCSIVSDANIMTEVLQSGSVILSTGRSTIPNYETVVKNLCITDEYPVENTHSIIRGNTNPSDSPATMIHKAKTIFTSRETQHNFRSTFTPPKNYTFSRSQLKYLNLQSSKLLFDVFQDICEGDGSIVKQISPEVLSSDSVMLPLGFTVYGPQILLNTDLPGVFQ